MSELIVIVSSNAVLAAEIKTGLACLGRHGLDTTIQHLGSFQNFVNSLALLGKKPSVVILTAGPATKNIESEISHLRSLDGDRHLGILVYSQEVGDSARAVLFLSAGADDYIERPVLRAELELRVLSCVNYKNRIDELRRVNYLLLQASVRDQLTGVLNMKGVRAKFETIAPAPGVTPFLMMLDVDDFKRVNDTANHLFGSYCLEEIAKRITTVVDQYADVSVGRFGGDEFVILGLGSLEESSEISSKVLSAIASKEFKDRDFAMALSTSIGLFQSGYGLTLEAMIKEADDLLYRAKGAGKNRVWAKKTP